MRLAVVLALATAGCRAGGGPAPSSRGAATPRDAMASVTRLSPPDLPLEPLAPPRRLPPPSDPAIALAASGHHTCVVLASGAVSCWGGTLGAPHRIAGWTDLVKVAISDEMLCGLHRHGQVECGSARDLEIEGDAIHHSGVPIRSVAPVRDLAAFGDAACVVDGAGNLACWMQGMPEHFTRSRVRGATDVAMGLLDNPEFRYAGAFYACAIARGKLVCIDVRDQRPLDAANDPIGKIPRLQLGVPRVADHLSGLTGPFEQGWAAGLCARTRDGDRRCVDLDPQLHIAAAPTVAREGSSCAPSGREIECSFAADTHDAVRLEVRQLAGSCAIDAVGAVACWGPDDEGELGQGRPGDEIGTPAYGLRDAIAIVDWSRGVLALRANGQLAYWGHGGSGLAATTQPVTFSKLTDAVQLVAGHAHACVLRRAGTVACFGEGRSDPVFGDAATALHGVVELRATDAGVLARTGDGTWLHVGDPQLGIPGAATPRPIAGAERAAAIAVAGRWICALDRAPGRVRCRAETAKWSTPWLDVIDGAVDLVGSASREEVAAREALTIEADAQPPNPRSRLAIRLADGRGLGVDLSIERGQPVAHATAIAAATTGLFTSEDVVCAREAHGISCASANPRFQMIDVPHVYDDAVALIAGSPSCALRADHQVVCFSRVDATLLGIGRGTSSIPVAVAP